MASAGCAKAAGETRNLLKAKKAQNPENFSPRGAGVWGGRSKQGLFRLQRNKRAEGHALPGGSGGASQKTALPPIPVAWEVQGWGVWELELALGGVFLSPCPKLHRLIFPNGPWAPQNIKNLLKFMENQKTVQNTENEILPPRGDSQKFPTALAEKARAGAGPAHAGAARPAQPRPGQARPG